MKRSVKPQQWNVRDSSQGEQAAVNKVNFIKLKRQPFRLINRQRNNATPAYVGLSGKPIILPQLSS